MSKHLFNFLAIPWRLLFKKGRYKQKQQKRKKQRNICYSGSNEYIVREKDESHITVVETKQSRLEQNTKMESSAGETSGGVER